MSDSMVPSPITVGPDGKIGADFSGHVHAEGLDLDEQQSGALDPAPAPLSNMEWLDPNGVAQQQINGYSSGGSAHILRLFASALGANGASISMLDDGADGQFFSVDLGDFAGGALSSMLLTKTGFAIRVGGNARTILDVGGTSDFVQKIHDAWAAPAAFLNGWVNFGAPYGSAAYRIDQLGRVWLTGEIKNGTVGLAAFTLPVGYRPAKQVALAAVAGAAGAAAPVVVDAGGNVIPSAPGTNAFFSLAGLSFATDNP